MKKRVEFPIGQRESQGLEFKGADALKKPFPIARGVVAMLNADGGEIWIGLSEQHGVATAAENIADSERAWERLFDHLLETIEPRLRGEVTHEVVEADGSTVLKLEIRPNAGSKPYTLLHQGGRHYLIRVGHRVRPMTRDEIHGRESETAPDSGRAELIRRRDVVVKRREPTFWIGTQPSPATAIETWTPRIGALLTNPELTGNRRSGWNFRFPDGAPVSKDERLEFGDPSRHLTTIFRNGSLDLVLRLEQLEHGGVKPSKEIRPLALLEYTISMVRLARGLAPVVGARVERMFFQIAIVGADGWKLPAFAPGTYGYDLTHEPARELEDGSYLPEPREVPWAELEAEPDLVGFRLVRGVYEAFGLREERIPSEYDRERRRLLLTD